MQFVVNYIKLWMCIVLVLMFSCDLCKTMKNVYRVSKHASKKISPTISAVLLECPKRSPPNCDRKMMVNIRVSPSDQVERIQKYLVLDEAFDQKRQVKAKLMSPYLIEITRGEPVLMYPLQFSKSIRCGSCLANTTKAQNGGNSARLQEETKGFTQIKGHADSQLQGNKEDIIMVSDENPGEAKDHLTDEGFINMRDLLLKAGSNQDSVHGGSGSEVANGGNIDSPPSETSDKDNSNRIKPPLVAKIHIGKAHGNSNSLEKSKRQQAEDEKNQELLQQLQKQEEKIKKDIIDATSKMNFGDVRNKRLGGIERKSGKAPIKVNSGGSGCTNCNNCESAEFDDACRGSGTCIKNCGKHSHSKISSKRTKDSRNMKQMKSYYQQRAHDDSRDKKLVRNNDLIIQELSDDSSNPDEPRQSRGDISIRDELGRGHNDGVEASGSSVGLLPPNRIAVFGTNKFARFTGRQPNQQNTINGMESNEGNSKENNEVDWDDLWETRSGWQKNADSVAGEKKPIYTRTGDKNIRNEVSTNYRNEDVRCCANCNCNSKCKCPQGGGISAEVKNKEDHISSLQNSNLFSGGAAPSTKELQMPVSNSYQSSKVPFTPYSNGIRTSVDGDKKSNNFPVQRSPPEHNEKTFVQLHGGEDSGEDPGQAHLCPNKNCQVPLPHIPLGEENEIDNLKNYKNFPSSADYPLHSNIHPFAAGEQKGVQSANEVVDVPYSNYDVRGRSPQFLSSQDNSGVGGGNNELISAGIDNQIYGSESNFGSNTRNKLLFDDTFNVNFDDNTLLTERKISDSSRDDDLFMKALSGHDKLPLSQELNNNFDPMSINAIPTGQKIFKRMNKEQSDNTEYDDEQGQEFAGFPEILSTHKVIGEPGYPKVFRPPGVLEQGIKHAGGAPGEENNCGSKSSQKVSRETFFTLPADPYFGVLPSSKFTAVPHISNDKAEFESIFDDPNLNTQDKMGLLDNVIDPGRDPGSMLDETLLASGYTPYDLSNVERIPFKIQTDWSGHADRDHDAKPIEPIFGKRSIHLSGYDDNGDHEGVNGVNTLTALTDDTSSCGCGSGTGRTDPCKKGPCSQEHSSGYSGGKRSMRSVSDIWYAVFNTSAPLQFLTTRVRIFRRRENSWWRIAPSITLTSLSGIYANANLSILFSSHVEMFSLEKPLIITDDHRVIFPKDQDQSDKNILAVNNCKYNVDAMNPQDTKATRGLCEAAFHQLYPDSDLDNGKRRKREENEDEGIYAIGDFGYFPTNLNALEPCPNDSSHLCLNILDTEAPAFGIKIQFPFRDNALVPEDYHQVRITSVINDGTTNGALLVTVMVVNEALLSREYEILIDNCPMACGTNNIVHRTLAPHIGEKITFLMPIQESNPNSKYMCDVEVKNLKNEVVAKRQMTVQPLSRCLCIWHCSCYCIPALASNVVYDACQVLPESKEKAAGFVEARKDHFKWHLIFRISLFLLWLMLLLGLLKGVLGCCIYKIDNWKYDYIQPMHRYEYASRWYRFFINTLFFLVFPFICCCKCFTPAEEESLPSSDWGMSFVQHQMDSDDYGPQSDDEETILSQHIEKDTERGRAGAEIDQSVTEYFCELYNDDDEERDTTYVLNALAESRESLKMMDGHYSEEQYSADPRSEEAVHFVRELVAAKIVYRTLCEPIGNANVPTDQSYSIRGYFLPAAGPGYQFITHIPLRQHWSICPDINTLRPIIPPIMLFSKEFTRNYTSKMDVLEASDLSVRPSVNAPCINVLVQDISMYHQPDPDDLNEEP